MRQLGFVILVLGLFTLTNKSLAQKTNPPGTIWLRDNLYIDLAPIANVHYREYEYFMSRFIKYNLDSFQNLVDFLPYFGLNSRVFLENLNLTPYPDSANLKINQGASLSWDKPANFEIYLNHPSYNAYPLVNISYDLAKKFCDWRTAMVQFNYSADTTEKERQKHYTKVRYRLANKEEWEYALRKFSSSKRFSRLKGALPPRKNYYTITNLSEIVEENNVFVNTLFDYKPAADSITFRCICEVEN